MEGLLRESRLTIPILTEHIGYLVTEIEYLRAENSKLISDEARMTTIISCNIAGCKKVYSGPGAKRNLNKHVMTDQVMCRRS
jgi:hypothetical protein